MKSEKGEKIMNKDNIVNQLLSILILPFNVIVTMPLILVYLEESYLRFYRFSLIGGIIITGGLILLIITIGLFINVGRGTLAPWDPTKKLVVVGPYKYVRNPMISGVVFILLGETIIFKSTYIGMWLISFFLINYLYFLLVEEPGLIKRFGKEYETYKQEVPRWIPRLRPWKNNED